jgi:hypothetical protein
LGALKPARALDAGAFGYPLKKACGQPRAVKPRSTRELRAPFSKPAPRRIFSLSRPSESAKSSPWWSKAPESRAGLEISDKTVRSHLTRLFRETGVTDGTQAALWAERYRE